MAKDTSEGGFMETVKTVFWALVIAIGFRSVFFQPFWIPSESMKDTLLIGDFLRQQDGLRLFALFVRNSVHDSQPLARSPSGSKVRA